jgi:hypothetical protein
MLLATLLTRSFAMAQQSAPSGPLDPGLVAELQARHPTAQVLAQRLGQAGFRTANGHLIGERDRFAALPSLRVLSREGSADYQVLVRYGERSVIVPIWDVGPWNLHDDYWEERREAWPELPRFVPQAAAAFYEGHNNWRDEHGREVLLPAAIELADGTFWDDLQMTAGDWVEVTFLWIDEEGAREPADPTEPPAEHEDGQS